MGSCWPGLTAGLHRAVVAAGWPPQRRCGGGVGLGTADGGFMGERIGIVGQEFAEVPEAMSGGGMLLVGVLTVLRDAARRGEPQPWPRCLVPEGGCSSLLGGRRRLVREGDNSCA